MLRPILAVAVTTALTPITLPAVSHAQSFDCAKASTAVEKQICADPNLSLMDAELGRVYRNLMQSIDKDTRRTLHKGERAWLHQRNACDTRTNDCVEGLYEQRLRQLDADYDVFTGWAGDFSSGANLQISTTSTDDGRTYEVAISGAGQNWTCDGSLSASVNDDGTALVVDKDNKIVEIQAAGTGLLVPDDMYGSIVSEGFCGAAAPGFEGFFARTSTAEDPSALDSRLDLAGIDSPNAARAFLDRLKQILASGDRQTFASLVSYPFSLYDNGKVTTTYPDATAFLKDYDQIVTQNVLDAISQAEYADLFVNYQGAMIGNGQVWFYGYGDDGSTGQILISAINP